jgi:hypothetical protein
MVADSEHRRTFLVSHIKCTNDTTDTETRAVMVGLSLPVCKQQALCSNTGLYAIIVLTF